jgi:hypothetical protein
MYSQNQKKKEGRADYNDYNCCFISFVPPYDVLYSFNKEIVGVRIC